MESQKKTPAPLASIAQLTGLSLLLYKRQAGIFIGYSAWLLLPIAASYVVLITLPTGVVSTVLLVVLNLVSFVLTVWISIALMIVGANMILGQPLSSEAVAHVTQKKLGHAILVSLIVAVIEIVGFVLFIVPGVVVSVWYAFAQTEVVLNGQTPLQALCRSRELVRERFWEVLWRLLGILELAAIFFILVSLLGELLTFLGVPTTGIDLLSDTLSVLYLPVIVIYSVALYLELKRTQQGGTIA